MYSEVIDGKEYRLSTVRGRTKLVSADGDLLNYYKRNQKSTPKLNCDGYLVSGGSIPVHLYVAHAWVDGYFEGAEVNHIDFDRTNNKASNLEWVTHKENIEYSVNNHIGAYSNSKLGEKNGRSRFTEQDVIKIRELYRDGVAVADIVRMWFPELKTSKDYRSIHSTFTNIVKRNTWKHIK